MESELNTTETSLPDLAMINRAELWLAILRKLCDQGVPITTARRLADEQTGFNRRF
jgi:hypothetical protein